MKRTMFKNSLKLSTLALGAFVLTMPIPAHAQTRNVSGVWSSPIGRFVVAHDPDSRQASFTTAINSDATGLQKLHFEGRMFEQDEAGFSFSGNSSKDFTFIKDGKRCKTGAVLFSVRGTLVGDLGGRRIHADMCNVIVYAGCESGTAPLEPVELQLGCNGVWR